MSFTDSDFDPYCPSVLSCRELTITAYIFIKAKLSSGSRVANIVFIVKSHSTDRGNLNSLSIIISHCYALINVIAAKISNGFKILNIVYNVNNKAPGGNLLYSYLLYITLTFDYAEPSSVSEIGVNSQGLV